MRTAKNWLRLCKKDEIIADDPKEELAAVLIYGATQLGPNKKRVIPWIRKTTSLLGSKVAQNNFQKFWRRLKQNKVFCGGKIYADLEGDAAVVEYCLLINVAQGYIKRATKGE